MAKQRKKKQNVSKQSSSSGFSFLTVGVVFVVVIGIYVAILGTTQSSKAFFKQKNAYAIRFNQNPKAYFSEEDVQWMINSEDAEMLYLAGDVLFRNEDFERTIDIYENLLQNYKLAPAVESNTYFHLLDSYESLDRIDDAIRVYEREIKHQTDPENLHSYYGKVAKICLDNNFQDDYAEIAAQCLKDYENINSFVPYLCLFHMGAAEALKGSQEKAIEYARSAYRAVAALWRDELGIKCPATNVNLALVHDEAESLQLWEEVAVATDIQNESDYSKFKYPCYDQEWPLYINDNGTEFLNFSDASYNKQNCFMEKIGSIFKLPNVLVSDRKTISRKHNGECIIYTSGFPHLNAKWLPEYDEKIMKLPIKYIENALILHYLDSNYFHLVVDGLSKIMVSKYHPAFNNIDNLKILVSPSGKKKLDVFKTFKPDLYEYQPQQYRYKIKNLYAINWRFPDSLPENFHCEDYYVPPPYVLRHTQSILRDAVPHVHEKRNLIIWQQRANSRRFVDIEPLYDLLNRTSKQYNLEFMVHDNQNILIDQMNLYSRAVVVIGVHGAGLTNSMFCRPGTSIIEIPAVPKKLSVYYRMSSIFGLPYYTIPSVEFAMSKNIPTVPAAGLRDIENTLHQILPGYHNKLQ